MGCHDCRRARNDVIRPERCCTRNGENPLKSARLRRSASAEFWVYANRPYHSATPFAASLPPQWVDDESLLSSTRTDRKLDALVRLTQFVRLKFQGARTKGVASLEDKLRLSLDTTVSCPVQHPCTKRFVELPDPSLIGFARCEIHDAHPAGDGIECLLVAQNVLVLACG